MVSPGPLTVLSSSLGFRFGVSGLGAWCFRARWGHLPTMESASNEPSAELCFGSGSSALIPGLILGCCIRRGFGFKSNASGPRPLTQNCSNIRPKNIHYIMSILCNVRPFDWAQPRDMMLETAEKSIPFKHKPETPKPCLKPQTLQLFALQPSPPRHKTLPTHHYNTLQALQPIKPKPELLAP